MANLKINEVFEASIVGDLPTTGLSVWQKASVADVKYEWNGSAWTPGWGGDAYLGNTQEFTGRNTFIDTTNIKALANIERLRIYLDDTHSAIGGTIDAIDDNPDWKLSLSGNTGHGVLLNIGYGNQTDTDITNDTSGKILINKDYADANYGAGDGTIGGTITTTQIAHGATTADSIQGDARFTYDPVTNIANIDDIISDRVVSTRYGVIGKTATDAYFDNAIFMDYGAGGADIFLHTASPAGVTAGFQNIFLGQGAGSTLNMTGVNGSNVGVGNYTMYELTSGTFNVSVGQQSMQDLTTGTWNVAVGHNAGSSMAAGNNNVAVGGNSMGNLTSGANNIAIGRNAAHNTPPNVAVTDLTSSVYIGSQSDPSAATGIVNEIAIGVGSQGSGSNTATIGGPGITAIKAGADYIAAEARDLVTKGYTDTNYEPVLGNPATDGYILSSTVAGVRTWIEPPAGGGGGDAFLANTQTFTGVNTFASNNTVFGNTGVNEGCSINLQSGLGIPRGIFTAADPGLTLLGNPGIQFTLISAQFSVTGFDPTDGDGVGNRDYNDGRYAQLGGDNTFTGNNVFNSPIVDIGNGAAGIITFNDGNAQKGNITSSASSIGMQHNSIQVYTWNANNGEFDMTQPATDDAPTDGAHIGNRTYNDARYKYFTNYAEAAQTPNVVLGAGWAYNGDTIQGTAATGTIRANGLFTGAVTRLYTININVTGFTSGSIRVKVGSGFHDDFIVGDGLHRLVIESTSSDDLFELIPQAAFTGSISILSVEFGHTKDDWTVQAFNLVQDTTPQLGGLLDVQSNSIYSSGGSTISVGNGRSTTGVVGTGYIEFFSNSVKIGSWDAASTRGQVEISYDDFGGLDMLFNDIANSNTSTISYFGIGDGFVIKDAANWNFDGTVVSGLALSTTAIAVSDTVDASFIGDTIFMTGAGATTITIPDSLAQGAGSTFTIVAEAAGNVTVTTTGTATINGSTSFDVVISGVSANKINSVQFIQRTASSDDWIAVGDY